MQLVKKLMIVIARPARLLECLVGRGGGLTKVQVGRGETGKTINISVGELLFFKYNLQVLGGLAVRTINSQAYPMLNQL